MKIAPAMLPSTNPTRPARPAATTDSPFERLLEVANLPSPRRERAFGFSELGIFGAASASPVPASPKQDMDAAPAREAVQTSPSPSPEGSRPATDRSAHTAAVVREAPPPSVRRQPVIRQQRAAGPPVTDVAPTADQAPDSGDEAEVRIGRRNAARPQASHAQLKRLSLTVSEQNGVIQVLAGSPEIGPEARERLRKAVARLAAEFGVTLARFTLNGSALEPDLVSRLGASHGDHGG